MNKEQEIKGPETYLNSQNGEFCKMRAALEQRIARAEARVVELEANVSALLTCLRIFGKVDGNELAVAYERYSNDYHQQLVEPVTNNGANTEGH
jgi:hypothetical protein